MKLYIIAVSAQGDDLIVKNNENMRKAIIPWNMLSCVEPGLKYRSECLAELRRRVDGDPFAEIHVSTEAEALILKATDAAQKLY